MRLKFKLKTDGSATKDIQGPIIAIGNHQCNFDFAAAAITLRQIQFNFVVTTFFFNSWFLKMVLGWIGAIPKRQFIPDISVIRKIYRAVGNGQSVFIFPEGQVGYYGAEVGIDDAIGKLIKHLKIPVVNVNLNGGFLSYPKWARATYPARMEAKSELILTPEQIETMSEEEIFITIKNALAYNDFDWQRKRMIPSKKDRMTEGLQNILYRCPACNRDFVMTSSGTKLCCSNCGYTVTLNRYAFFESESKEQPLIYDNIADWFLMQRREVEREVEKGSLPFVTACKLTSTKPGSGGYFPRGEGTLSLDFDGLHFDGTRDGKPYSQLFSVDTQSAVTHNTSVWGVDFAGDDCNYAFSPDDPRKMIKIVELYSAVRAHRDKNIADLKKS